MRPLHFGIWLTHPNSALARLRDGAILRERDGFAKALCNPGLRSDWNQSASNPWTLQLLSDVSVTTAATISQYLQQVLPRAALHCARSLQGGRAVIQLNQWSERMGERAEAHTRDYNQTHLEKGGHDYINIMTLGDYSNPQEEDRYKIISL